MIRPCAALPSFSFRSGYLPPNHTIVVRQARRCGADHGDDGIGEGWIEGVQAINNRLVSMSPLKK